MPPIKTGKRPLSTESSFQHLRPQSSASGISPLNSHRPCSHVTVTDNRTNSIPALSYQLNHLNVYPSPMKDAITLPSQPWQAQVGTSATAPTSSSPGTPTMPTRYEHILPRWSPDSSSSSSNTLPPSPSFVQPPSSVNYTTTTTTTSLPLVMPATRLHALTPLKPPPPPPPTTAADLREQERRKSHRAIERRRRDRINDKIMQLKCIIPTCAKQNNLHKLSILQGTIDYIQYLKNLVDEQQQQNQHPSVTKATERSNSPSLSQSPTTTTTRSPPPDNDHIGNIHPPLLHVAHFLLYLHSIHFQWEKTAI